MKTRQGIRPAYNAQAVVAPLDAAAAGGGGMLITAAEVVDEANDLGQLAPMVKAALRETGLDAPPTTAADSGYCTGAALATVAQAGWDVLMPAGEPATEATPYHKDHFRYDPETDSYTCPAGQTLSFRRVVERPHHPPAREYRAVAKVCRGCPAFGACTSDRNGRTLKVSADEPQRQAQRQKMATPEAKAGYRRRKATVEPVFGLLKEGQGARQFLLRGLAAVQAEWTLLATAFNLKTLHRVWRRRPRAFAAGGAAVAGAF